MPFDSNLDSNIPSCNILRRLQENIFEHPYASDGKDENGVFAKATKCAKSIALAKPVIQINGPRRIAYLCFDVDRAFAGAAWMDANIPVPNIIIVNPANLHAYLIYELAEPVWMKRRDDNRPGEAPAVRFLKAVQKAMGKALGADSAYNSLLVKNPFHPSWRTRIGREQPYTLAELSEHLDLNEAQAELRNNPEGRNCTLFDSARLWAYRYVRDFSNLDDFREAVITELEQLNDAFPVPLSLPEIRDVAKSVSKWTWNRYTGSGNAKRRGVMHLDPSESLTLKQQKGQAYSTRRLRENTLTRIRDSVIRLLSHGEHNITKSAVAGASKLSLNTVRRYWSQLSDLLPPYTCMVTGRVTVETVPCGQVHQKAPIGAGQSGYPDTHQIAHSQTRVSTPTTRAASIRERIRDAILKLRGEGLPVNKSSVAHHSGVTRKTVRAHWNQIMEQLDHEADNLSSGDVPISFPTYQELLDRQTGHRIVKKVVALRDALDLARRFGIIVGGLPDVSTPERRYIGGPQ